MNTYQVALPGGGTALVVAENYYVDSIAGLRFVDQFGNVTGSYANGAFLDIAVVNPSTPGTVVGNAYQSVNANAITGEPLT